jgi:energy-coupling factor transporter ATP-binding protein EcfA2
MKIFFVIGSNGVGKSTLVDLLKRSLISDFEIHDFDERGVPNDANKSWRQTELLYWLTLSKQNLDREISTIICGFVKPIEILESSRNLEIEPIVCLLDVVKSELELRLLKRYNSEIAINELMRTTGKSVEKFLQDSIYTSSLLRIESERCKFFILNTSLQSPQQVAEKVISWISASMNS